MNSLTSDVVEATVEVIEKNGWCQHTAQNFAGEVCIVGGLWEVCGLNESSFIDPVEYRAKALRYSAYEGELAALMGVEIIGNWNDLPGRTKDEVVDKLMGVAKHLRNEGR